MQTIRSTPPIGVPLEAGERGYRRLDAATVPPATPFESAERHAMLPIPDDLSILAFLRR
jgi:hypothetical protein